MELRRKQFWILPVFLLLLTFQFVFTSNVAEAVLLDTCISTSGEDICNYAVCNDGKCDAGGQDCLADVDCQFCTISYRSCATGCADEPGGTYSGVCSVSKLLCNSSADCRPSDSLYNGCMQDVYQQVGENTQNLVCTANDISIAETSVLKVIEACKFPGDFGTIQLEADLLLTATARHDIGIYLATDGGSALVGTCLGAIVPLGTGVADLDGTGDDTGNNSSFGYCSGDGSSLSLPPLACSDTLTCPAGQTCVEFGGRLGPALQDTCGDIDTDNNPISNIQLPPITLPCIDRDGDGQADLPSCLSWREPGANDLCLMPLAAYPGAPSKCKCQILDIPLGVPKSLEVVKALIPDTDGGLFDLRIDSVTLADDVGDGGTTGRQDVSNGQCTLDGDSCTKDSDCNDGLNTVAGGDVCEPYDRTVSEIAGTDTDLGDYSTDISCVSRLGACTGDSTFVCSLDTAVPDPCVILNIGTCTGTPVEITSCTDCTTIPVAIERQQTDILCTITNTLEVGTLKLIKTVTNDNGGTAEPGDWTLTATGDSRGFSDSGDSTTFHKVTADVTYTLSESSVSGYTAGSWSCDGGTQIDDTIKVSAGAAVTCTINNDDIAPTLKLVKTVTNDNGGTKQPSDWTLTATGDGGFSDSGNSTTFHAVKAGVGYVLSESTVPGYTAGNWSCDGGNLGGSTVTLGLNENVTCTINNNDNQATLIIIKHVINDNGGTKTAADFSMTIGGVTAVGGNTFAGAESPGVNKTLTTVGAYNVTEGAVTGYTQTSASADCSGTIALGETKTCTITNDDQPAHLIVIKHVINDNGGTKTAADFSMTIGGVTAVGGNTFAGAESPGVNKTLTTVGAYNVTEGAVTGYTQTSASADCSGTIALGETKTCTITNNDIAPKLTLVKTVINDNGGTLTVADFPLYVNGNPVTSGVANTLSVGSYTASEQNQAGYQASAWGGDCAANGSVTLALGDDKTCTITNNDIPATLTLIKTVINDNGGTLTVADFPLYVNGNPVTSGAANTLTPGTYTASETSQAGYAASAWGGDCATNGSVTLALGENKTCTITNNDIPATLTLIKTVINDNGGTLTVADFPLFIGTTQVTSGAANTLSVGSYTASETSQAGYAASAWGGHCAANGSVTLALGENKTCTITNDDIAPTLTVIKYIVNSTGSDPGLFNLQIDSVTHAADVGNGGTTGTVNVNVGSHSVSETAGTNTSLDDYVTVIDGDCASDGSITLALAENKTCTITNTAKGKAEVDKTVSGATPPAGTTFTFQLRQGASTSSDGTVLEQKDTDASGSISFATDLVPGQTYQICEWVFPGWNTNLAGDGPLFVPNSIIPPSLPNPNVNNLTVCADFTVSAGATRAFNVDNTPPPGGRAVTIGFWKNWASCSKSKGGQDPMLDQTLALANIIGDSTDSHSTLPGIVMSAASGSYDLFGPTYWLVIHGNTMTQDAAPDCLKAVRLLDKSNIDTGKKMASDAAFNLAAQLLATELNFTAGAAKNGTVINAVNQAVLLLGKYKFDGKTHTKISAADTTTMNNLAKILDDYNNNR